MKAPTKAAHERRVAEFMREARTADPDRVSLVESKYPVLTESQMQWRRRHEVPMGLLPLATDLQGTYIGRHVSPYSKRSNENRRNPHPAD